MFFLELRCTKPLSASKNEGFGFSELFEPQRKSCDVRVQNTLWSIFSQDDTKKKDLGWVEIYEIVEFENRNWASSSGVRATGFEEKEEGETDYRNGGESRRSRSAITEAAPLDYQWRSRLGDSTAKLNQRLRITVTGEGLTIQI